MDFLSPILESASAFLASDPTVLAAQVFMAAAAFIVAFFVLFTTRDILLRSNSFLLQAFFIVLVAALPIVGFFMYLLLRPSRTLAERALHIDIATLLTKFQTMKKQEHPATDKHHKSSKK